MGIKPIKVMVVSISSRLLTRAIQSLGYRQLTCHSNSVIITPEHELNMHGIGPTVFNMWSAQFPEAEGMGREEPMSRTARLWLFSA